MTNQLLIHKINFSQLRPYLQVLQLQGPQPQTHKALDPFDF